MEPYNVLKKVAIFLFCLMPLGLLANENFTQTGQVTFYAKSFSGKKTTSGEPYKPAEMTAAHASLPLNSYVKVHNLLNGKSVIVRVNDRMSRRSRYVIDVSHAAAKKLGIVGAGMGKVKLTALSKEEAMSELEHTEPQA